jgi:hypothetical protein
MKKYILILFVFISTNLLADCQACWNLRSVKILKADGNIIEGYILWNKAWYHLYLKDPVSQESFGDSVLYYHVKEKQNIILYKEIVTFENLFGRSPLAINNIDTIDVSFVIKINPTPGQYNGLEGACQIQVISRDVVNLLSSPPIAIYSELEGNPEVYFISYNKEYDINKLMELYQSDYFIKIKELEKVGVLILAFYWD